MADHASAATAQKRKYHDEGPAAGTYCAKGCGFFGAAATGGMCSRCYKDHADSKAAAKSFFTTSVAAIPPPQKKVKVVTTGTSSDTAAAAVTVDISTEPSVKQQAPTANRCATCRKKVGLMGFRCRCDGTFCIAHRYSDKHDCGFDYKTAGREQIAKHNPIVVVDKIIRRI